jgi:hypothetical protein
MERLYIFRFPDVRRNNAATFPFYFYFTFAKNKCVGGGSIILNIKLVWPNGELWGGDYLGMIFSMQLYI